MNTTYSASGLDQVEQLITEQYTAVRLQSGQENPTFTTTQTTVGHLTVGRMVYNMTVDMDAEPLSALGIVHPRSGRATYRSRGEERLWIADELCVHADPADTFTAAFDHLDCDFAIFDPTLLGQVAGPGPGDSGPVRLTGYAPISRQAGERWMTTFEFVRQAAAQPDLAPLVAGSLMRVLAAATLVTFPSNALLGATIEDRRDAHPPTLRRAIAFIESNPDLNLSVVDIARAAFVTPRALQLAFQRHLGTTPMRYLRRVRLDWAHAELLAANPAVDTVTAIAARWGWAGPSRFAADYLAAYGRHPHQTLRS